MKLKESRSKIIKLRLDINKVEQRKITKVKIWFLERVLKLIDSK